MTRAKPIPPKNRRSVEQRSGFVCEGAQAVCDIEECGRTSQCHVGDNRVCLMHYKRHKRHGHFNLTRKWNPPTGSRRVCSVDGCEDLEDGRCGMCKMHDTRRRRHGDPLVVIHQRERDLPRGSRSHFWTGEAATYAGAHQRVRKARGRAAHHACVGGCGRTAAHWSYDRTDPNERHSEMGPYSVDINHYVPRCVPCHKAFDLGAIRDGRISAQGSKGD